MDQKLIGQEDDDDHTILLINMLTFRVLRLVPHRLPAIVLNTMAIEFAPVVQ